MRFQGGGSIAALLTLGSALAVASPAMAHRVVHAPKHKPGAGTSTNWSGYSVDGTNATFVTGSWTVQPAQRAP